MAGVNLIKKLKARKAGGGADFGASSGSGQKLFGLDVASLKDGVSDLSKADKIRFVLLLVGVASIPLARDWTHEYTFKLETEKKVEIDKVTQELNAEKSKLQALKGLAQEADAYEKQMQELQRKLNIIESLGRNRNLAVKMVDFVVNRMPTNLWLTKMTLDTKADSKIELLGNAVNMQTVSEFMRELEGAVFFPRWQLQEAQKADGPGANDKNKAAAASTETRSFSLNAKVVPL